MPTVIEYRVRPVTRYLVTRFIKYDEAPALGMPGGVGSSVMGEFENEAFAAMVADAFSKTDPCVNRVVYEPHEPPPANVPDERYAVGGPLHHAMTR